MIVIPGRIPVAIHPIFWLFAGLIGYLNSQTLLGTLIWTFIIFISVLIHEYGHALTALLFKQTASIQLIALGGITQYKGPPLKLWKQFIIVFNGPLFGFFIFLIATALLQTSWPPLMTTTLKIAQFANLFWTIVNLLPILPLDGGQLLRIVLESIFGMKGFKASLFIGGLLSTLIALYFFLIQAFLAGAIFFLFAFQGFASWRQTRFATDADREDKTKQLLLAAETALQNGNKTQAKELLSQILASHSQGVLAATAAQYLAHLHYQEGHAQDAYTLLLAHKNNLAEESQLLLHKLASQEKNHSVVAEFSTVCYQLSETQEVALKNARAFAQLDKPKLAGGWLQTAWHHGGLDLARILNEPEFAQVKNDPIFRSFTDNLQ